MDGGKEGIIRECERERRRKEETVNGGREGVVGEYVRKRVCK